MTTQHTPERLPSFLAGEFQADYWHEVPEDIIRGNYAAAQRVLSNPEKFPKADFNYFEKMDEALCGRIAVMDLEKSLNDQLKEKRAAISAAKGE